MIKKAIISVGIVVVFIVPLSVFLYDGVSISKSSKNKPNIIYIMADDLGYGDIGVYGQKKIKTPNIDRLASEGMKFTQHYTGSPVCAPARHTLLTGLHVGHSGITHNGKTVLPAKGFTVARLMKHAGYTTGIIGKWALGALGSSGYPLHQGFDYWYGYNTQGAAHNYYPDHFYRNKKRVNIPGNVLSDELNISQKRTSYGADLLNNDALQFIDTHQKEPFFLMLHYTLPHVNNELQAKTGDGFEVPHLGLYKDNDWTKSDKSYAEMVTTFDRYVGEVVSELKALGLGKNTLIFITSDNGPTGVRGLKSLANFDSTGGLRGMKGMLFEGGIRVPQVVWWPGHIAPGSETDLPTAFWDLIPTLAELVGQTQIPKLDGISYLSTLLGKADQPKRDYMYWAYLDRRALRLGDKKLVIHPTGNGSRFLYNLKNDPQEKHNLAESQPNEVKRFEAMMKKIRAKEL